MTDARTRCATSGRPMYQCPPPKPSPHGESFVLCPECGREVKPRKHPSGNMHIYPQHNYHQPKRARREP
jgi:hypothetical protein